MEHNIYIISLSPSIDYILEFDNLEKDKTNRPKKIDMYPAGKGIHISMILNSLDKKNESIIFSSGEFEEYFYKGLDQYKINYKKFKSEGNIRINLKLIDERQTECSVKSPTILDTEIEKLKKYLKETINENDYVIFTGSIPDNVSFKIYGDLVDIANSLGAKSIVDSFGDSLNYAIEKKPFLIKPNIEELSLTTNLKIKNIKDAIKAANILIDKGVENILLSMGEDGALLINKNQNLQCKIGNWNKKLVNAAGAGDSMLGGFVSEFIKTSDFIKSLKMGIICGSATAYSTRIANHELINELVLSEELLVKNIK